MHPAAAIFSTSFWGGAEGIGGARA